MNQRPVSIALVMVVEVFLRLAVALLPDCFAYIVNSYSFMLLAEFDMHKPVIHFVLMAYASTLGFPLQMPWTFFVLSFPCVIPLSLSLSIFPSWCQCIFPFLMVHGFHCLSDPGTLPCSKIHWFSVANEWLVVVRVADYSLDQLEKILLLLLGCAVQVGWHQVPVEALMSGVGLSFPGKNLSMSLCSCLVCRCELQKFCKRRTDFLGQESPKSVWIFSLRFEWHR